MPGPTDPITEMILRLMASGNAGGLPMKPSRGLQGHLNARLNGFPAPQVNNVVPGPGSNPPISQDPWFDADPSAIDPINDPYYRTENPVAPPPESQFADEARLPPNQFQNAGDISPEDIMQAARSPGRTIPAGNGEFYLWAQGPDGKKIRVDGPFTDELQAQREFKLMQQSDPQLITKMGVFVGGPEG